MNSARSQLIQGVRWLGEPMLYPGSHGDTWSSTWAADGALYAVADDTLGIDNACRSNLAIHRITGTPPAHRVETINPMSEYLALGAVEGYDMWKGNGLAAIDGVLYLSVSQHTAMDIGLDNIQRAHSASIVKSTDYGRTWSAKPAVGDPMFPTHRFATPFFVQFGQDYADAFGEFADYVHAVSSGGVWNNGNHMVLGRVRRDLIGKLDPGDWQFFAGLDEDDRPRWVASVLKAQPIFRNRDKTSMTGVQYVPAVERFVMAQWAYTRLDSPRPWDRTVLELYEASRPWGPWCLFHSETDWGEAYYNPSLPAKWFDDGGRRLWMTMAGNWTNAFHEREDIPFSYGFTVQQLELCL